MKKSIILTLIAEMALQVKVAEKFGNYLKYVINFFSTKSPKIEALTCAVENKIIYSILPVCLSSFAYIESLG